MSQHHMNISGSAAQVVLERRCDAAAKRLNHMQNQRPAAPRVWDGRDTFVVGAVGEQVRKSLIRDASHDRISIGSRRC
jgi:hypothetical protein